MPQKLQSSTTESPDIKSLCNAIAQAFIDDPFYRAVTIGSAADETNRLAVLAQYFHLAIAEGIGVGEVQVSGTDGAAIWITNELSDTEKSAYGSLRNSALEPLLGPQGYSNYLLISDGMAKQLPHDLTHAWYLSIVGVRPEARRQRIAQRLLEITLHRADQRGAACYLETFNLLSVPFYERLGFKKRLTCFEEVTSQPYWILTRAANPEIVGR